MHMVIIEFRVSQRNIVLLLLDFIVMPFFSSSGINETIAFSEHPISHTN